MSATQRVIIITGATDPIGIGLATAKAIHETTTGGSTHIILTSRDEQKGRRSVEAAFAGQEKEEVNVVVKKLLLDDDSDVERFAEEIKADYGHVDVLINNAAAHVDFALSRGEISLRDAFNQTYNTNVVSTHVFTYAMIPLLLASTNPRLLFISTGLSSMEDTINAKYPLDKPTEHTGWPKPYIFNVNTYRASKGALNAIAIQWAKMLLKDGVKVFILDPGLLATNLGGIDHKVREDMGAPPPSVGGEFFRDVANGKWDHEQCRLLDKNGVLPW